MIVKVCGMREPENIRAVEEAGADYIGFICYERSPRYVAGIPAWLPHSSKRVGVFVNADRDYILRRRDELQLDWVQLHGHETPDFCHGLKEKGMQVIKAFALDRPADIEQVLPYEDVCDLFLFDTPCAGYGGSGKCFDWSLLNAYQQHTPFLLSGGLNGGSLEPLSAFSHPAWAGIDLNSGFETAPACKDANALRLFIEQFKRNCL